MGLRYSQKEFTDMEFDHFFKTDKEPKIISTVDLTVDEVKEYFNMME